MSGGAMVRLSAAEAWGGVLETDAVVGVRGALSEASLGPGLARLTVARSTVRVEAAGAWTTEAVHAVPGLLLRTGPLAVRVALATRGGCVLEWEPTVPTRLRLEADAEARMALRLQNRPMNWPNGATEVEVEVPAGERLRVALHEEDPQDLLARASALASSARGRARRARAEGLRLETPRSQRGAELESALGALLEAAARHGVAGADPARLALALAAAGHHDIARSLLTGQARAGDASGQARAGDASRQTRLASLMLERWSGRPVAMGTVAQSSGAPADAADEAIARLAAHSGAATPGREGGAGTGELDAELIAAIAPGDAGAAREARWPLAPGAAAVAEACERVLALVHGRCGVVPDAARGRVRIGIDLTDGEQAWLLRGLRLADARIDVRVDATANAARVELEQPAGAVPAQVVLEVLLPRGPARHARVDGSAAELVPRAEAGSMRHPVQLVLDRARTLELQSVTGPTDTKW